MQPCPGSAFEVIETEFLLELLMSLLAHPSGLDGGDQRLDGRISRQVGHVVLLLAARSSFPDQPDLVAWHALNAIVSHPVLMAIG